MAISWAVSACRHTSETRISTVGYRSDSRTSKYAIFASRMTPVATMSATRRWYRSGDPNSSVGPADGQRSHTRLR